MPHHSHTHMNTRAHLPTASTDKDAGLLRATCHRVRFQRLLLVPTHTAHAIYRPHGTLLEGAEASGLREHGERISLRAQLPACRQEEQYSGQGGNPFHPSSQTEKLLL
jgi:hypothetical protein